MMKLTLERIRRLRRHHHACAAPSPARECDVQHDVYAAYASMIYQIHTISTIVVV
jgi:hypothetical protein